MVAGNAGILLVRFGPTWTHLLLCATVSRTALAISIRHGHALGPGFGPLYTLLDYYFCCPWQLLCSLLCAAVLGLQAGRLQWDRFQHDSLTI